MASTWKRRKFLGRMAASAASVVGLVATGTWLARGRPDAGGEFLRPPGARLEPDFLARCIRCGRCADACPNRAIVALTEESGQELSVAPSFGQRGTPVILPRRQACMLCNGAPGNALLCTEACPSGALEFTRKDLATVEAEVDMGTAELDFNLCYSYNGASCGACVRACPLEGRALKAGLWEKPIIDPEVCVGCGLCERACLHYPQAIRVAPREA